MTKTSTDPPAFRVRPAQPEEAGAFYAQTSEQYAQMGAIGCVRMDFGKHGTAFWHTWHPRGRLELNMLKFKIDLQLVVDSENISACSILPMEEQSVHAAFCRLYYKLKHHGGPIFTQMLSNLQKIRYSRMLWSEDVISLNKKISDVLSQVQFLTQLQQAGGVDPDTFISSNNKLSEHLRRLKQEKARLLDTDSDDLADRTRDLMDALEDGPDFLDSFDAELFDALVEKIIVDSNEHLRFRLKNSLELTEQIERTRR